MARLPLSEGIPRFKESEDKVHTLVHGDENAEYVTETGARVPSIRKMQKRIDTEGEGWLANARDEVERAKAAADSSNTSSEEAATMAQASASFLAQMWSPANIYLLTDKGVWSQSLVPNAGHTWADSERTMPVTAPAQRIGAAMFLDQDRNPVYAAQASSGDRGYLTSRPVKGVRNLIYNSAAAGAVGGAPGTMPVGWAANIGTLIRDSISLGTDSEGYPSISIELSGSLNGNAVVQCGGNTQTAVEAGETYTWSVRASLDDATNITSSVLQMFWRNSAGDALSANTDTVDWKSSPDGIRTMTAVAPAGAAYVLPQIRLNCAGAVDTALTMSTPCVNEGNSRDASYQETSMDGMTVTERGADMLYAISRTSANQSLSLTLPSLGSAATVAYADDTGVTVLDGQTVNAGAYQVLGSIGARRYALFMIDRALSAEEEILLRAWLERQRGIIVSTTPRPDLTVPAKAISRLVIRQDGLEREIETANFAGQIGGAVTPRMFGGDPTGVMASGDAVAQALATGAPVMLDGNYRLTTKLDVPARSTLFLADPNCGLIADMAEGKSIQFGDDCFVPSLRVKSSAYPVSAISNTAAWSLGSRGVYAGNRNRFGAVMLDNLAGGLELIGVSGCQVEAVLASNLRSRYGWSGGFHVSGGGGHRVGFVGVKNADRGMEVEDGAVDVSILNYLIESVYPNGYVGAPADGTGATDYLRTSWSGPSAHSHSGEQPCVDIRYGDGIVRDSVNPINIQSSGSSDPNSYPQAISIGRIVIDSPRTPSTKTFKEIVNLCGINLSVESIEFRGSPAAEIEAMIATWGPYTRNIAIRQLIAKEAAWYGRLIQANTPEFSVENYDIETQAITDEVRRTYPAMNVNAEARNFSFGKGIWRQPRYHGALFHAQGGGMPTGGRRVGTRVIPASANPTTNIEAPSFAALDAYRADN